MKKKSDFSVSLSSDPGGKLRNPEANDTFSFYRDLSFGVEEMFLRGKV